MVKWLHQAGTYSTAITSPSICDSIVTTILTIFELLERPVITHTSR
ncbi:MAG: hypothetical protein M9887_04410 [Chitinophagales bacterium]|nr:hypothetical protein [Chitinophagales bacterium]